MKTAFRRSRGRSARAFTLIELLVVVAIIAVLAAIAVPNMQEATVRARVSRSQADMRSQAVALEAYRTDHTAYPRATLYEQLDRRLQPLTTPVAYLTALAEDPFFAAAEGSPYATDPNYCYASGNIYYGVSNQYDEQEYRATIFSLAGRGPDRTILVGGYCMAHPIAFQNGANVWGAYDPTNGTMSPGDLLRLGGGALGRSQW